MKNHQEILKHVIAKGGLLGVCATHYINDEQDATQYIIELSEQCHVSNLKRHWGRGLINDILIFARHHRAKNNSPDDS